MKKVFALILCLILTLSVLVACADKAEEPADTTAAATTAVESTSATTTKAPATTTKAPAETTTEAEATTVPIVYDTLDYTPEY